PAGRELDRIGHEIGDDLQHKPFVRKGADLALSAEEDQLDFVCFGPAAAHAHTGFERFGQIEIVLVQGEFARFRFSEVQDVIDDGKKVRPAVVDVFGVVGVLLVVHGSEQSAPDNVGKADDGV